MAGGEFHTPAPLSVDPATGRVLFDFDGHVHARGLDLDAAEAAGDAPTDRRVNWIREGGGVSAYVVGRHGEGFGQTSDSLELRAAGGDVEAAVAVTMTASREDDYATLYVAHDPGEAAGERTKCDVTVAADNGAIVDDVRILDDAGRSSFPRFPSGAHNRKISGGHMTFTWNGTAQSDVLRLNHGLGDPTPAIVATAHVFGVFIVLWGWGINGSEVDLIAHSPFGAIASGTTMGANWLAISSA